MKNICLRFFLNYISLAIFFNLVSCVGVARLNRFNYANFPELKNPKYESCKIWFAPVYLTTNPVANKSYQPLFGYSKNFEMVLNRSMSNSGLCEKYEIRKIEGYSLVFQKDSFTQDSMTRFQNLLDETQGSKNASFIFLVVSNPTSHSLYKVPGFLNFSLHMLTFGLVPFYGPDWVHVAMLQKESNTSFVDFKQTEKKATMWSWTFLQLSQDYQPFQEGVESNIERLYNASLSELLTTTFSH